MQALYQAEAGKSSLAAALDSVFSSEEFIPETLDFARVLAEGTLEKLPEIDAQISRLSIGWPMERMSQVDKSILRLAVYELLFLKDTPKSVAINEAIELAKKYSSPEAAKFINGILGNLAKSL
jgi:N utilization substance protein B